MSPIEHIEQVKESYLHKLSGPQADLPREALAQEGWPRKVTLATGCIHENLFNPELTISWMKEQCRLDGHNFSSRFRHYLGHTPKQYILRHRIAVAKVLFVKDELKSISVSEIAYEVGFSGASAFAKAFKHITGTTPHHWRKKHED